MSQIACETRRVNTQRLGMVVGKVARHWLFCFGGKFSLELCLSRLPSLCTLNSSLCLASHVDQIRGSGPAAQIVGDRWPLEVAQELYPRSSRYHRKRQTALLCSALRQHRGLTEWVCLFTSWSFNGLMYFFTNYFRYDQALMNKVKALASKIDK